MANNSIKTDYGYDLLWASTASYQGKILVFEKAGNKTPLHYQKETEKQTPFLRHPMKTQHRIAHHGHAQNEGGRGKFETKNDEDNTEISGFIFYFALF